MNVNHRAYVAAKPRVNLRAHDGCVLGDFFPAGESTGQPIARMAVRVSIVLVILVGVLTFGMIFHRRSLIAKSGGASAADFVQSVANQLAAARLLPDSTH